MLPLREVGSCEGAAEDDEEAAAKGLKRPRTKPEEDRLGTILTPKSLILNGPTGVSEAAAIDGVDPGFEVEGLEKKLPASAFESLMNTIDHTSDPIQFIPPPACPFVSSNRRARRPRLLAGGNIPSNVADFSRFRAWALGPLGSDLACPLSPRSRITLGFSSLNMIWIVSNGKLSLHEATQASDGTNPFLPTAAGDKEG